MTVIDQCPSNLKHLTTQSGNYASSSQQCCPEMPVSLFMEALPARRNWKQPAGHRYRKACTEVDAFTLWNMTERKTIEGMTPFMLKAKRMQALVQIQLTLGCELLEPTHRQIPQQQIPQYCSVCCWLKNKPPSPTLLHCSRVHCIRLKKPHRQHTTIILKVNQQFEGNPKKRGYMYTYGFLGGSDCKELACNVRDLGLIPGSVRSPGERNNYSLQQRIPWTDESGRLQSQGVTKSWTQLSDTFTFFSHVYIQLAFIRRVDADVVAPTPQPTDAKT